MVKTHPRRASELHTFVPPLHAHSALHTSTSTRLQRASRAPYMHACKSASRLQGSMPLGSCVRPSSFAPSNGASPDLQGSIQPYFHVYTPAALLPRSILPYLHVATPEARLQTSRPPYLLPPRLHAWSATPAIPIAMPSRLQACSSPPGLQGSMAP